MASGSIEGRIASLSLDVPSFKLHLECKVKLHFALAYSSRNNDLSKELKEGTSFTLISLSILSHML